VIIRCQPSEIRTLWRPEVKPSAALIAADRHNDVAVSVEYFQSVRSNGVNASDVGSGAQGGKPEPTGRHDERPSPSSLTSCALGDCVLKFSETGCGGVCRSVMCHWAPQGSVEGEQINQ
jgi:hypothetical protein